MTRQEKYPETATFHYYNANPKNRITYDCVIRAISTATGIDYKQVTMEMAKLSCETGYGYGENRLLDKYLTSKGWIKQKQLKKANNKKYTMREFVTAVGHDCVVTMPHHLTCILDGKVWDIWDCSKSDRCAGVYWVRG